MKESLHKSYRPFTVLTFRWNYLWSGLEAGAFHSVNVFLHCTVSLLVFYMTYTLLEIESGTVNGCCCYCCC